MNGSTVRDQRTPECNYLLLTLHLTGRHVQLVRDKSAKASNQEAQEVYIPIKKGVCADKQDDCEIEYQHQKLNRTKVDTFRT